MTNILVAGATSAIAEQCCRIWAARGDSLFLVGRDAKKLEAIAADLRVRSGAKVHVKTLDLNETGAHAALFDEAAAAMGRIDMLFVAHGTLTDQARAQTDWAYAEREMATNFTSVASLTTHAANRFEAAKAGTIAVISSVAGDRGRPSNYVYGTSKAATSAWLSGMRARLHAAGVAVVTIKPGFVDTPMTAHLKKGTLFASPEKAARIIVRAIDKRKPVAYVPGFWRPILFVLRHVPERIFMRLRT